MENPAIETALVKYICPVCGRVADENIVINSLLTKEVADKVKKLHNQIIGYADKVCKECAKYKDNVVFFIGIDPKKSDPKNPYRTGQIVGVEKDAEIVKHTKDFIIKLSDNTKLCYIDENLGKSIGLWDETSSDNLSE